MKTTVKTPHGAATVWPMKQHGEILISLNDRQGAGHGLVLTPDQAGALIFGLERAMDTIQPGQNSKASGAGTASAGMSSSAMRS